MLSLELFKNVKQERPGQWQAKCPAHQDSKPSLALALDSSGKWALHCHAGCTTQAVLEAVGLAMSDLFPPKEQEPAQEQPRRQATEVARYQYHDEQGQVLYEVLRYEPKTFRQRRPDPTMPSGWSWTGVGDVRKVLYKLPQLLAEKRAVFLVEGEKDADNLHRIGLLGTCTAGGASSWSRTADNAKTVLKDRIVYVLPDNDNPGRKYAIDIVNTLTGIAKSVTVIELPNLGPGGDVSDWITAGGTKEQLIELASAATKAAKPAPGLLEDIDCGTFAERINNERNKRAALVKRLVPYHVGFLDDSLGGILPNDLILLTASSGAGKTQMAASIAETAARNGLRVTVLALEAEQSEYERRIKYRALSKCYRDGMSARGVQIADHMSYRSWYMGKLDHMFSAYEDSVDAALAKDIGERLVTIYRGASFGIEHVERVMNGLHDKTDLFILDHLHFLDLPDEKSENAAMKDLVKRLRDVSLRLAKPVLVVAHLRKADRYRPALIPSLDDIHGSSDIVKTCTQVVVLAHAKLDDVVVDTTRPWRQPTYIRVLKDRLDGAPREVAVQFYDRRLGAYEQGYELGKITYGAKGQEVWQPISRAEAPRWAKNASFAVP